MRMPLSPLLPLVSFRGRAVALQTGVLSLCKQEEEQRQQKDKLVPTMPGSPPLNLLNQSLDKMQTLIKRASGGYSGSGHSESCCMSLFLRRNTTPQELLQRAPNLEPQAPIHSSARCADRAAETHPCAA